MIVDTSAIISILHGESGADSLLHAITKASRARMSAASYLELGIVVDRRRDPVLSRDVDALLEHLGVETVALDARQATIARAAFRDFGKGMGHPAQLNYGDCFSYALAAADGEPLLFVGDDFSRTDIRPAV